MTRGLVGSIERINTFNNNELGILRLQVHELWPR